ncbi:aspartate aminotransferase family protein [bacterium]|nr:aspartate aminotransferase family protein [bacterium]
MDFSVLSFSQAPQIKHRPPGPESKKILDFQFSHESSALSYPKGMPMALKRGKGATIEDVDGNKYIDFFGGAGVLNVGHSNPEVIESASEQLSRLTHSLDVPNPARMKLVERLASILPEGLDKIFFGGPTGSDAVESAVKLAKYNTGRFPMISFEGAYHGMTAGALSLSSGKSFKQGLIPLVPETHFIPYAYCYRCPFGKNPSSCRLECGHYLEHILEDPHSGVEKPAAVIVEAIQGEGGSVVPPDTFIPLIREICDKHQILMIVDEIQAGLCRTGKMFAFQHSGVVPDIITLSKGLGGLGFPLSCIAYKRKLDTWPSGKHIGTFRGNVLAFAAGNAALSFMNKNRLADHSLRLGDQMLSWLKEIEKESPFAGEARGKGLMLGLELVKDKSTKEPAPELAQKVRTLCHQRGLLVEIGGHYSNVVRLLPSLILTQKLAQKGLDILRSSVKEIE